MVGQSCNSTWDIPLSEHNEKEGFALGPKGRLRNEVKQEPPTAE